MFRYLEHQTSLGAGVGEIHMEYLGSFQVQELRTDKNQVQLFMFLPHLLTRRQLQLWVLERKGKGGLVP